MQRAMDFSQRHRKSRPDPNSKIGQVYDLLMTGEYVKRPSSMGKKYWQSCKEHLQIFWGLEYQSSQTLGIKCIGMWDGPYFVPIERMK